MHNKNALMRNVLITVEEVLFHAPSKHVVDARMIENSIIVAEERFIVKELGYELYTQLADAKNKVMVDAAMVAIYQPKLPTGVTLNVGDIVNSFEFLSADQIKFWKQSLWKLVAECVMATAFPEGFVQFGSEGTFHNSPPAGLMVTSGQVTPLITSMKWALDKKIQDRIAPLINSMHSYLCKNLGSFSLYIKAGDCPDCTSAEAKAKFTGIALNLYEDDEDDGCCNEPGWK